LDTHVMPPSLSVLERVLTEQTADLFRTGRGLDIERLRIDLRLLRVLASKEERPRLEALARSLDEARHERFREGLGEVLAAAQGQIEGVILNGAQPGDAEYRGLFSDVDFTVVIPKGADPAPILRALEAAFDKRGITLNAKGKPPSADVEAMIQDFLPGAAP